MSRILFPMSQRAIPKTNAEREAEEAAKYIAEDAAENRRFAEALNAVRPHPEHVIPEPFISPAPGLALGGNKDVAPQNQPEELFHEMTKEAQVWKTYVKETDRWDKELVDGRNSSLDVLLIFAALFSAVSTAFITVSLGDLKPDPIKSASETLLVMSETLIAIANSQPVPSPAQNLSDSLPFSPSRSAVVVNVLWLLSLSLSVAVSLIAMLAKEWCYEFMSARFGQIYEQGRRRQQKWNGMERWKMHEVLMYLPVLMHLALLLFAMGLCIYLWEISVATAVPVNIVTGLGVCVYLFTTILPAYDQFCPYSTPVTALVKHLGPYVKQLPSAAYLKIGELRRRVYKPTWLRFALIQTERWLQPKPAPGSSYDVITQDSVGITMDVVTSQMVTWMITKCEDSHSVDTALQAIAGARAGLDMALLRGHGALELVYGRLKACMQPEQGSQEYVLMDMALLPVALKYSRAMNVLPSGDSSNWAESNIATEAKNMQRSLIKYAMRSTTDPSLVAAAVSAPLLFQSWPREIDSHGELHTWASLIRTPKPDLAIATLRQYVQGERKLAKSMLPILLENSVCYLIGSWPNDKQRRRCSLPTILVHVFLKSRVIAEEVAHSVAVILAATAFAVDPCSGGEWAFQSVEDRQRRVVKLLLSATNPLDRDAVDRLFIFGLVGLLPYINLRLQDEFDDVLTEQCSDLVAKTFQHRTRYDVYGLPESLTHGSHCAFSVRHCLLSVVRHPDEELSMIVVLSIIQPHVLVEDRDKSKHYLPALIAFRCTQSRELRRICLDILDSQRLSLSVKDSIEQMHDNEIMQVLCDTRNHANGSIAPVFLFYFKLLMTGIMLSTDQPLDIRRASLRRVLTHRQPSVRKSSDSDRTSPSEAAIISHALQSTDHMSVHEGVASTMDLIEDFCHEESLQLNWVTTLEGAKRQFHANRREIC